MSRSPRIPSMETLAPQTPADRHALYALVKEALLNEFPTHGSVVRQLALVAVRHLDGEGTRVLIRGPREAERESLVRTLAAVLDWPFVEVEVASLAETNWRGADLPFLLSRLHEEMSTKYGLLHARSMAERACILVSRLDDARLASAYSSSSTRDHRAGKQSALAQLFAGRSIPVAPDRGSEWIWRGGRALVVGTADVSEIEARHLTATDLRSWGMSPDLADAISAAVLVTVDPPTREEVELRLRAGVRGLIGRFLSYGYHLRVTEQVIRWVAGEVMEGPWDGGAEAGIRWIASAAEASLIRMLEESAPSGRVWVVARDDISLPDPPRGVWRE